MKALSESKVLSFCFWFWSREWGRDEGSLPMREVAWFSASGVFVMIKVILVSFCSIRGWCYSGWWVWDLRNTRTASEKWNISRVISRLYQWNYNLLRVVNMVYWLQLSVTDLKYPSLLPVGSHFSFPVLQNICSEEVEAWNFVILVEYSNTKESEFSCL